MEDPRWPSRRRSDIGLYLNAGLSARKVCRGFTSANVSGVLFGWWLFHLFLACLSLIVPLIPPGIEASSNLVARSGRHDYPTPSPSAAPS